MTDENEIKNNNTKSKYLLIAAILLAIAVFVWVILSFDDQPGEENGIGQSKLQKIMVENKSKNINEIYL